MKRSPFLSCHLASLPRVSVSMCCSVCVCVCLCQSQNQASHRVFCKATGSHGHWVRAGEGLWRDYSSPGLRPDPAALGGSSGEPSFQVGLLQRTVLVFLMPLARNGAREVGSCLCKLIFG